MKLTLTNQEQDEVSRIEYPEKRAIRVIGAALEPLTDEVFELDCQRHAATADDASCFDREPKRDEDYCLPCRLATLLDRAVHVVKAMQGK